MEDSIEFRVYKIIKENNRFMTLKEIYNTYKNTYNDNRYADLNSAIRTRINRRCLNRDLHQSTKKILFFLLNLEKH